MTDATGPPPVDLATLDASTFTPHVGSAFAVAHLPGGLSLTLRSVDVLRAGPTPASRHSFSLEFTGPRTPMLSQGVFTLDHEAIGRLELFLVPLQPDEAGARYEAVFT